MVSILGVFRSFFRRFRKIICFRDLLTKYKQGKVIKMFNQTSTMTITFSKSKHVLSKIQQTKIAVTKI